MRAYRLEAIVAEDGSIVLHDLPFNADQRVEVIVLPVNAATASDPYPLRDQPYRYDGPFEPAVDPQHWEANNR